MKKIIVAALTLLALAPNAWAGKGDIVIPTVDFVQGEFEDLSRQLGIAIANRQVAPAESLGIIGFDLGKKFKSHTPALHITDRNQ